MKAQDILDQYLILIDPLHPLYKPIETELKLPAFPPYVIKELFLETAEYIQTIPPLIHVNGPAIVVGDIHGNIRDLIRIIKMNGLPHQFTYIFLGDYVDRGEFSVEVLTLLFSLQLVFKSNVILLRGNHEAKQINSTYGFKTEVNRTYGNEEIFNAAQDVFDNLSLAALVDNTNLCLHGGISSRIKNISQIEALTKPINLEEENSVSKMVKDILWSDPVDSYSLYQDSPRGEGVLFGVCAINEFLKENQIKRIIRGHSCVKYGCTKQCQGAVVTVFSSGSYNPGCPNNPAFLSIDGDSLHVRKLDQLPQPTRDAAQYQRAVVCKTLADLNSGRPIGPNAMNRYWSSRRHSMDSLPVVLNDNSLPLPPLSVLAGGEVAPISGSAPLPSPLTKMAMRRRHAHIKKCNSDIAVRIGMR